MKVLACAVGFGLGPNGKLCSIVNYNKKYEWYACGDKLDLSIYKENPFIDTCWSKDEKMIENFIKKYNIEYAIDVLDPEMAIFLKRIGIKVIYVDSLPFMWTSADIIPYNVDYYCAQKFPNYSINSVLKPIKNLIWVNPITLNNVQKQRNSKIVVNFGGLHSPFGEGKEYFEVIMKTILPNIENKDIIITGGENVVNLTKKLFPNISCCTYAHEDFLEIVSGAELFITSPGLTTIYETCGMDIKTIVMPPQNLSQFYNISIAEKICKNVKTINWNCNELTLEHLKSFKNIPEEETVKYIYEQISNLSKNEKYMKEFNQYVSKKLKSDFRKNKIETYNENGVIEISKILYEIMEER